MKPIKFLEPEIAKQIEKITSDLKHIDNVIKEYNE